MIHERFIPFALVHVFAVFSFAKCESNDCRDIPQMIAVPLSLMADSDNIIPVEFGIPNIYLTINSYDLKTKQDHRGDPIQLRDGRGTVYYRIPFRAFKSSSIRLTFQVTSPSRSRKCNSSNGSSVILPVIHRTTRISVQTDKSLYIPGDVIRFHVFCLSAHPLSVCKSRIEGISVIAPNGIRLKRWSNVPPLTSMNGFDFELTSGAMTGNWSIVVDSDGFQKVHHVSVLPSMPHSEVSIKFPPYIYVNSKTVGFKICVKQPNFVSASISAAFCVVAKQNFRLPMGLLRCLRLSKKTNCTRAVQCIDFNISTSTLLKTSRNYRYQESHVYVRASVTDQTTSTTVNSEAVGADIAQYPLKLVSELPEMDYPGLPYFGRVRIVSLDGKPQAKFRVKMSAKRYWMGYEQLQAKGDWGFAEELVTDANGFIDISIPPFPRESFAIVIRLSDAEHFPKKMNSFRIFVKSSYSPSDTYMQMYPMRLRKDHEICKSGKVSIRLQANVPLHDKTIKVWGSNSNGIVVMQRFGPVERPEPFCRESNDDEIGHFKCMSSSESYPKIKCLSGWHGDSCRTPVCPGGCYKGVCRRPGVCVCRDGWFGSKCNQCNKSKGCRNGCCYTGDDCQCFKDYKGRFCERKYRRFHVKRGPKSLYPLCEVIPFTTAVQNLSQHQDLRLFTRDIQVNVSDEVLSSSRLAAWFVHSSNNRREFVTASIELSEVKPCSNEVKFSFDSDSGRPGRNVIARIKSPGETAKCVVTVTDNPEDSALNQKSLSSMLKNIRTAVPQELRHDPYRELEDDRCRFRFRQEPAIDSSNVFKNLGIFVVSDIPLRTVPCSPPMTAFIIGDYHSTLRDKSSAKFNVDEKSRGFFGLHVIDRPSDQVSIKTPYSVTTLRGDMACFSSQRVRIAAPDRVRLSQPFLLRMELPRSINRGETFTLPVQVINTGKDYLQIKLTLFVKDQRRIMVNESTITCLCNFGQETSFFNVSTGSHWRNVSIEAVGQLRRRSLKKSQCLQSSNVTILRETLSRRLPLKGDDFGYALLSCSPPNALSSGSRALIDRFKTHQDAVTSFNHWKSTVASWNGNRLVMLSYGCGEQNIFRLAWRLSRLSLEGDGERETEHRKYVALRYQHQMKFRLKDGSYSPFGVQDEVGSTWLTAFVLKTLVEANQFEYIDDGVISSAVEFLNSRLQSNGCFREDGRSFTWGKGRDEATLTAEIFAMLLPLNSSHEAISNITHAGLNRAFHCLKEAANATRIKNLSTCDVALRAYSLRDIDRGLYSLYRNELNLRRETENGVRLWREQNGKQKSQSGDKFYSSTRIQTTAYSLLCLLDEVERNSEFSKKNISYYRPTVEWLISQIGSVGVSYNAYDRILIEKVLTSMKSIEKSGLKNTGSHIRSNTYSNHNGSWIQVKTYKKTELRLDSLSTQTGNTTRCGLHVVHQKYLRKFSTIKEREVNETLPHKLSIRVSQSPRKCCMNNVSICISSTRSNSGMGMYVLKVLLPSGWHLLETAIDGSRNPKTRLLTEMDEEGALLLYFEKLSSTDFCVNLRLQRRIMVEPLKRMLVQLLDVYQPSPIQEQNVDIASSACLSSSQSEQCPSC